MYARQINLPSDSIQTKKANFKRKSARFQTASIPIAPTDCFYKKKQPSAHWMPGRANSNSARPNWISCRRAMTETLLVLLPPSAAAKGNAATSGKLPGNGSVSKQLPACCPWPTGARHTKSKFAKQIR